MGRHVTVGNGPTPGAPARRLAACALILLMTATAGAAQTVTGTLQGTVTDTSGAVLPGVLVNLRNIETGQEREVSTNDAGFYTAPFLPLGAYRITATLAGFGPVARDGITVTLNETRVVDFQLDPAISDEVVVTGDAAPINTTSGEIKSSLSADQIIDKPTLSAGSFLTLAETFPGFQENPTSGQNNPTLSSGSSINFSGTGTRGATFQINGVNNDDSSENQNRQGAAISTIQEFQVITNTYTAEFGRAFGAVVLVQTKSGTNQVHGDVYEYHQDSANNAKAFFALTKPDNRRDEYGGTIGFPLLRDRLFGFLAFDQTRSDGRQSLSRDLFTPAELTQPRLTRGNDTPANRAFIDNVLARFPSALTPNDARSPRTWTGHQSFDWPDEDYSGRLDWSVGSRDTLWVRQQYTRQTRDNEDIIIGEQARQNNKQQNIGATWTRVFSATTVGELRYGLGIRNTNVDIAAGNDTPIVRFTGTPVTGSIIGNAGAYPINRYQTDHQFVYNLSTLVSDRHSVKAGTDVRLSKLDDRADNFSRGFWTFTTSCAGLTYATPYAAFMDGCVNRFERAYGPFFLENRLREYNVYVQDEWRLGRTLTVNAGIRYEYVSAPEEREQRIDYGFDDDVNNIGPRVSVAWTPGWRDGWLATLTGGPDNASVRGGYAIAHGRLFQSVFSQGGANVRFNPPNAASLVLTNQLNLSDPTNGFAFVPGVEPQARVTLTRIDPDLEMPYAHQWNLTLERRVPLNSAVRLSYTGSRGMGLPRYGLDNLPVSPLAGGIVVANHPNNAPLPGAPDLRGVLIDRVAADVNCAGTGFLPNTPTNAACPTPVPIANNEISFVAPRTNERRPDPRYGTNLVVTNGGDTWYHGLQVEWVKRLSAGLQFQAAYTWSKAIDTVSEATFVGAGDTNQTGPNRSYARGYGRFHTPHRFTLNGSYLLPFFLDRRDLIGQALGGWQLSGVVKLIAGTPFTVIDTARDLDFDGFSEGRPVLLDSSVLFGVADNPATSPEVLRRDAFRRAQFGDTELVGRNTFFLDGVNNVDLGLYKSFSLPRGHRLIVRFEAYNALNQVQFGFPQNNFSVATFGTLNTTATAYAPRTLQFAVRYVF